MRLITLSCIFLAVLLSGCAHPKTVKGRALPQPRSDAALVVIIRPRYIQGSELGIPILVDGQRIGKIANNSYMYQYLSPGRHTIQVEDEYQYLRIEGIDEPVEYDILQLDLKPGQQVFYMIEWKLGVGVTISPGTRMPSIVGTAWQKLPVEIARDDLQNVHNTPTDEQYEQLKAAGLIEFERKANSRK